jgi:hypothetical protein
MVQHLLNSVENKNNNINNNNNSSISNNNINNYSKNNNSNNNNSSTTIDCLEIARQITLIDHALFTSIPLYIFLLPNSFFSSQRHKQLKNNELRKFIDRFNAISLWVTESILNGNTAEDRAATVSFFIKLAGFFRDLFNYSSLMAIISAFQQGSITRLKKTFNLVSKVDLEKLFVLQVFLIYIVYTVYIYTYIFTIILFFFIFFYFT